MKKLFNRTLSILCAVMLLISAVSAWATAEEEPATPTDLNPAEGEVLPEEPAGEPEGEHGEEDICSVEVVITKALTVGQSWEGRMKKTKPAILKLDVTRPGTAYILVEGKNVWATVEKTDRQTEPPARTQTDSETSRMVLTLQAEEGSYLITLGPVEPNLLARAKVTVMDQKNYEAWEVEQANTAQEPEEVTESEAESDEDTEPDEESGTKPETEPEAEPEVDTEPAEMAVETIGLTTESEEETEEETETEPAEETNESDEDGTESDNPESEPAFQDVEGEEAENDSEDVPVERHIEVITYDDTPYPVIGDIAHFRATLYGYEELTYTVQWQCSPDGVEWNDLPNETALSMDIAITTEINVPYWRIVVYIEDDQES